MLRFGKSSLAIAALFFFCLLFSSIASLWPRQVLASPAAVAGGSILITAVVQPVRIVLINKQGKVIEIQSNSRMNVTPIIYESKYNTKPVRLTSSIYSQYTAILAHINTQNTGVIYRFHSAGGKKLTNIFKRIYINSYKNLLAV